MTMTTKALPGCVLATLAVAAAAAPPPIPKVDLVYPGPVGTIFDVGCADLLKVKVDPEAVQEAVRRAPEFQALWDREGPAYLETVFSEVGLPHPYAEVQATLTVCPGVRPMSAPLFINVRRYLSTASPREPDWLLVETIFHELMHTYVRPVNASSALRRKYAAEAAPVVNHLHVMALEKLALTKLGRAEELKRVGQDYKTLLPPAYKRAWTIVDEIEGYEPLVAELKAVARQPR